MGSSQSFYSITITNPNSTTDLASPSDGFVDFNTVEDYVSTLETVPITFTFPLSTAKRRANVRYRMILLQMGLVCNCYVLDTSIAQFGGSLILPPTSVSFQLIVEHGDSSLYTNDENNPGQFLTGIPALTRMISRGLQTNKISITAFDGYYKSNVYDPTPTTTTGSYGGVNPFPRTGERVEGLDIGPICSDLAAADGTVTITKLFADLPQ